MSLENLSLGVSVPRMVAYFSKPCAYSHTTAAEQASWDGCLCLPSPDLFSGNQQPRFPAALSAPAGFILPCLFIIVAA